MFAQPHGVVVFTGTGKNRKKKLVFNYTVKI